MIVVVMVVKNLQGSLTGRLAGFIIPLVSSR